MTNELLGNYMNAASTDETRPSPHTTLIMACYKVERYLPVFLASMDAQLADHDGYELIFVVDGCPENSAAVVQEWAEQTDYAVRILTQINGGVASARNRGLEWARGMWVSSPDPDDQLAPDYLANIERARAAFPAESMLVGRIRLRAPDGAPVTHPLDNKFVDESTRVVDLAATPDHIQTLGGTVFFERARITEHGLLHNTLLPTASDADFIMRFLLHANARYVLVPDATYIYQRRADDSSIVKTQQSNIARFRTVFGTTHRALLELAGPECPQWLANTLLYFTFYLFRRNLQQDSPVYSTDARALAEIGVELRENLRRIGPRAIEQFRLFDVRIEIRVAWLLAAGGEDFCSPVEVLRHDRGSSEWTICFYAAEAVPPRDLALDAQADAARIAEHKVRTIEFLGEAWAHQHILRVQGDASEAPRLAPSDALTWKPENKALTARVIRKKLGQARVSLPATAPAQTSPPRREWGEKLRGRMGRLKYSLALRSARRFGSARRMTNAVVLDLREAVPGQTTADLNIWRVLDKGQRASSARARSVWRGSLRHFVLMKHARALVSDRTDIDVRVPFNRDLLATTWRYIYAPQASPALREYRTLNKIDIDRVLADNLPERDLYSVDGSYYQLLPSQVVSAFGYRDSHTLGAHQAFFRAVSEAAS